MNTRRTDARRIDKEIANAGFPRRGNQVPPLEKVANDDQGPVNPSPLTDGVIRETFLLKDVTLKSTTFIQ